MISSIRRRLRRQRAAIAKPSLINLVHAIAYHAMMRRTGAPITAPLIEQVVGDIAQGLRDAADLGAFTYFGIRHAGDLGALQIDLVQVDSLGRVMLDERAVVDHILAGGDRGEGWMDPSDLAAEDLER